jgi:tight adherence protein C
VESVILLLGSATALLLAGSGGLLYAGLRSGRTARESSERFERIVRGQAPGPIRQRSDLRSTLVEFGGRRVAENGADEEISVLLARAGWRGSEAVALFTGLRVAAPLVATGVVALLWFLVSGRGIDFGLALVAYASFTVSYLLPKMLLRMRAEARCRRLRDDVSVFTHLLRVLYECGLSTEQALQVFAQEQRGVLPDVSVEIGEVIRMVAAGSDVGGATRTVADEVRVEELTDLFAMIRQIDRYGGQVQEPLMRFARLLEDRERTRLQEAIGRLSAKLTMVMVVFLLPALLTFVGGPGFIAVIRALRDMEGL